MKAKRALMLVLTVLALAALACGDTNDKSDEKVRTLAVATQEEAADATMEPTPVPATATPSPTSTEEIEGLLKEGTHLVGTDIEPGIYVGLAGEGLMESCHWARLSNLTGQDDILANGNAEGLYYVEVLPGDKALQTACELLPIDKVPAPDTFLKELGPGTYLVGRDIGPGLYRGKTGTDITDSCYWARLSNVSGQDDILANDNATGQFFIEVSASDFALMVGCTVSLVE